MPDSTLPAAARRPDDEVHAHPDGDGFYHLAGVDIAGAGCRGTACFVARHLEPERWRRALEGPPVHCVGRCYRAPARSDDPEPPHVAVDSPTAVVLERVVAGGARDMRAYRSAGGGTALATGLSRGPDWLLDQLDAAALRGRGGAAFPVGRKWRTTRAHHRDDGRAAVVVCNADEGDPGAYIDRVLLEDDPFAVIEGMAIAAHAVGANRGMVYVRAEYPQAAAAMRRAVAAATSAGLVGPHAEVTRDGFRLDVVVGGGSYVCGEETALINALEGRRPEVRARPPFPAERGFLGAPTLVNNVETLATIPWIVRHGGAAYASLGSGGSRGTKVVSLSSLFRRPGLYEVEFGVPVRRIVEDLGGGVRDAPLRGVLIGGPLAGILPPWLLDTPFTVEDLRAVGADVGHGGVVAFDERTSIAELVEHVLHFGAFESCGKCTPCRAGAPLLERLAGRLTRDGSLDPAGAATWRSTVDALALASLCGHGTGIAAFARSIAAHYPEELGPCFT
jgi:NADH:ubiquinone oxidoreductase subunit F (NADH-binding)